VIDNGTVIARGTSDELKASVGGQRVALTVVDESDGDAVRSLLANHGVGEPVVTGGRTWVVPVDDGPAALAAIVAAAAAAGIALHDAGMRRPTLDDVFLQLTGRVAEESDETTEDAA